MLVTGGLLVLVLGLVAVLALAPRLRVFDDRRARLAFIVVLAVVAVAVPVVTVRMVDRVADDRESDAAAELFAWLGERTYADAVAATIEAPDAAPGVVAARVDDGELVLQRPVVVAWQSRCVIATYPSGGLPSVERTHAPCP